MKVLQNSDTHQKLEQFGVQAIGCVVAFGVAFVLVLAWVMTGPIFRLGDWITRKGKSELKSKWEIKAGGKS